MITHSVDQAIKTMRRKKTAPSTSYPASNIREQIVGINAQVPLLDGRHVQYINFDNAASTPVLSEVLQVVNNFMPWYSSVHRGTGFKSVVATEAYEQARQTVADFFGANSRDHVVIFGKNSTEAINKLSYRLPLSKDDIVLVSLIEHHSNDLPWRSRAQVKRININEAGRLDEQHLEDLLKRYKGRIKLVAISGGSNVTGYMPDIHAIAKKVHSAGAQILVDCAQLAPHRAISIKPLKDPQHLDYIAISAHKMYAPFGTGALIGRRDTFETGEPEYCGGGTIDLVTVDEVAWASLPDREEAGSPNVVGAVALAASLKALKRVGMQRLAAHEAELTAYTLKQLAKINEVEVYGDPNPARSHSRLGVIPFNVKGVPHSLVAAILGTEWGIGVRNGCFCAHPYISHLLGLQKKDIEQLGKEVKAGNKNNMPGLVRVSFGMYNTAPEVDRLIEAIQSVARGLCKGRYVQDVKTGEYSAIGWHPIKPNF